MAEPGANERFRVAIDTGGTFTDIVLSNAGSQQIHVTKVPSTPDNPAIALMDGIERILAANGTAVEALDAICHGTTVATNALLQGQIDDLALIVTKGFRHILEIARQSVPDSYGNSYFWVKPDRLVPVHRVFEIDERLDFRGRVLRPLDEDSIRAAAADLRKYGVNSVGVCLIHGYANPAHEERVREILEAECPEIAVSLSSDVWPEYREYERAMTTLVDAFVKPHMRRYLGRIDEQLPEALSERPFLVMQSSGGVLSAEQVAEKPIVTALSGPAAGVIGASAVAEAAGFRDVVTLDAGGTSTDICLVEDTTPQFTTNASIGPFPVRLPMIDIRTVGTGGGSIAYIDPQGHLKVGPISAGADPGPICYAKGGDRPTITDANLVLGRIPERLIGGGLVLDAARARDGLAELAERLDRPMSPERLAEGIIEIANWTQANLIRQMTIEQGIDPRRFALLSFGGSGPAQSPAVMAILDLEACIVPPNPGNLSALGLLLVDYRSDHVFTRVRSEDELDPDETAEIYDVLAEEAAETLAKDGIGPDRVTYLRQADVRYAGQSMEVRIDVKTQPADPAFVADMVEAFHAAHERTFGYAYRGEQKIEVVNFVLSGFGAVDKPRLTASVEPATGAMSPEPKSSRKAYFDGAFRDVPVFDRAALGAGARVDGPLVVEEFGSTTVAFPGQTMVVDGGGNLIIRKTG